MHYVKQPALSPAEFMRIELLVAACGRVRTPEQAKDKNTKPNTGAGLETRFSQLDPSRPRRVLPLATQ